LKKKIKDGVCGDFTEKIASKTMKTQNSGEIFSQHFITINFLPHRAGEIKGGRRFA